LKTKIIILIIFAFLVGSQKKAASQGNTWKLSLNNNVGSSDGIGSANNADFKIFSNNHLRINVGKNGMTEFFGKVKMNVDTLNVKGIINVDSMRIKGSLHIGDSSLVVDPDIWIPSFTWTDRVSSNRLALNLMRRGTWMFGTYYTSNIRMGIGTQAPQHMLHLNCTPTLFTPTDQPVNMAFTNAHTGATVTDGFQVGIQLDGTSELKQQENLPIIFYENDNSMFTLPI